jgi:hypothetical protein
MSSCLHHTADFRQRAVALARPAPHQYPRATDAAILLILLVPAALAAAVGCRNPPAARAVPVTATVALPLRAQDLAEASRRG